MEDDLQILGALDSRFTRHSLQYSPKRLYRYSPVARIFREASVLAQ